MLILTALSIFQILVFIKFDTKSLLIPTSTVVQYKYSFFLAIQSVSGSTLPCLLVIQPLKLIQSCQHYKVKSIIPVQLQNSSSLAFLLSHPSLTPSLPLPSITVNQRDSGVCSSSNTHRKTDRHLFWTGRYDSLSQSAVGNICQL